MQVLELAIFTFHRLSRDPNPAKQDFWSKINILKGNHSNLRIQMLTVHQKLGMLLETKVHP